MKILASFVGRLEEYGGDLRCLGLIEAAGPEAPLSFRLLELPQVTDLKPVFGATGLARYKDKVIVSLQWHTPSFIVLDSELNFLAMPEVLVEDVHSIAVLNNQLIATETLRDAVVTFDLPNFENKQVLYSFNTPINSRHLNCVTVSFEDEILINFHRDPIGFDASAVVVNLTKQELVDLPDRIKRMHSLRTFGEKLVFCDSGRWRIWTGEYFIETLGYARGLELYFGPSDDYVIAASCRIRGGDHRFPGQCAVQIFNRETKHLVNQILIPERWEIYDLLVLE
jgi:hypothetical protein